MFRLQSVNRSIDATEPRNSCFNWISFRHGGPYMHCLTGPSLFQVIACRPFVKSFIRINNDSLSIQPNEQTLAKSNPKYHFFQKDDFLKRLLEYASHYADPSNSLYSGFFNTMELRCPNSNSTQISQNSHSACCLRLWAHCAQWDVMHQPMLWLRMLPRQGWSRDPIR